MRDRRLAPGTLSRALPTLVLAAVAVTLVLSSTAVAAFLKITARTPRARAVTLRSVFLPRLR